MAEPFEVLSVGGDALRVDLIGFGASVVAVWVPDRDGRLDNVACHLHDAAAYGDHTRNPHLGAMVGRYANRIAGARIEVDGVTHRLDANNGRNTLHGGMAGWSRRAWTIDDHDETSITCSLVDPDGERGFPGEVRASVRYAVDGDELRIDATATCDRATVVSMTNHTYWNLAGGGVIDDHGLRLGATRYALVDDELIPTGAYGEVADGVVDVRATWDNWFERDAPPDAPIATMREATTGRVMTMWSNQPGVQVYTGHGMNAELGARSGLCVEAGVRPDSAAACILRPGEVYRWSARHRFGVEPLTDGR